jgi:hypothetical protein
MVLFRGSPRSISRLSMRVLASAYHAVQHRLTVALILNGYDALSALLRSGAYEHPDSEPEPERGRIVQVEGVGPHEYSGFP